VWLEDFDGRRYMDCVSSWWVNLFGMPIPVSTPRCAISWIAGARHSRRVHTRTVIELSEALVSVLPLVSPVAFADNGSSAVEVAVKIDFHIGATLAIQTSGASSRCPTAIRARPSERSRWAMSSCTRKSTTAVDGCDHRAVTGLLRTGTGRKLADHSRQVCGHGSGLGPACPRGAAVMSSRSYSVRGYARCTILCTDAVAGGLRPLGGI